MISFIKFPVSLVRVMKLKSYRFNIKPCDVLPCIYSEKTSKGSKTIDQYHSQSRLDQVTSLLLPIYLTSPMIYY